LLPTYQYIFPVTPSITETASKSLVKSLLASQENLHSRKTELIARISLAASPIARTLFPYMHEIHNLPWRHMKPSPLLQSI